jgi:MFS family permease
MIMCPLCEVVMNVTFAFSAYPAGRLSDRVDRQLLLAIGAAVLVVADLVLGTVIFGVALWGFHMGIQPRPACCAGR